MVNTENLGVLLVSSPDNMNNLHSDFQKLLETIDSLPCNPDVNLQSRLILRAQNTATTYYGKERIHGLLPVSEFPENYFKDPDELRLIILLHELIHACQRQTVLRRWDEHTMTKLSEYKTLASLSIQMSLQYQRTELKKNAEAMFSLFQDYFKIIFEVWNHLFMKANYPNFFEQEMINIHKRISYGINEGRYDDWDECFMFHVHIKLLESVFFSKITKGIKISNEFQKLAEFWRTKLRSITDDNQFKKLYSIVEPMTRIDKYPDSQTLELQYLTMCELIWTRKVFE